MELFQLDPMVIDEVMLSVRESAYRRIIATSVLQYAFGDVVLSRRNGEDAEIGRMHLSRQHVRALFAGKSRLLGDVIRLDGPGEHTLREVWRENGNSLLFVTFDQDHHIADSFRLFADEVPAFLAFCWKNLKETRS